VRVQRLQNKTAGFIAPDLEGLPYIPHLKPPVDYSAEMLDWCDIVCTVCNTFVHDGGKNITKNHRQRVLFNF